VHNVTEEDLKTACAAVSLAMLSHWGFLRERSVSNPPFFRCLWRLWVSEKYWLVKRVSEQGGFGVPVANVLFAPCTPACALPGASCAAVSLAMLSHWGFFGGSAPVRIPHFFSVYGISGQVKNIGFVKRVSEQGGFGVPVANVLFAPCTPPARSPARPAPRFLWQCFRIGAF